MGNRRVGIVITVRRIMSWERQGKDNTQGRQGEDEGEEGERDNWTGGDKQTSRGKKGGWGNVMSYQASLANSGNLRQQSRDGVCRSRHSLTVKCQSVVGVLSGYHGSLYPFDVYVYIANTRNAEPEG